MRRYLPDLDNPDLQPYTRAYLRVMFAHAEFEHRVVNLMGVITKDSEFGERPENRWSTKERPTEMGKLIDEHQSKHHSSIPEKDAIVNCLRRAIPLCNERNLLAHGVWWKLDTYANTITVRSMTIRPNEEQHHTRTVTDINKTASALDDLEVELWKLQWKIEERDPEKLRQKIAAQSPE